jgi:hypothetical protein
VFLKDGTIIDETRMTGDGSREAEQVRVKVAAL